MRSNPIQPCAGSSTRPNSRTASSSIKSGKSRLNCWEHQASRAKALPLRLSFTTRPDGVVVNASLKDVAWQRRPHCRGLGADRSRREGGRDRPGNTASITTTTAASISATTSLPFSSAWLPKALLSATARCPCSPANRDSSRASGITSLELTMAGRPGCMSTGNSMPFELPNLEPSAMRERLS